MIIPTIQIQSVLTNNVTQRCEPFKNKMEVKWMVTLAGVKVPEKFLSFQRYFFPENDVWECAC